MSFKDCEYRFVDGVGFFKCKEKEMMLSEFEDYTCDNCTGNIHLNCEHYNPKKDYCLKWFESDVSEHYQTCSEKSTFDDKELSRKWSN